jgi:hypothetical protein
VSHHELAEKGQVDGRQWPCGQLGHFTAGRL